MPDRPVVPRPAATVVLLRPGPDRPEILLTRRPASMAFAGDAFVFPGGRVEEADGDPGLAARTVVAGAPDEPAFAIAAIRELFEEAGVLLAARRDGRVVDAAQLAGARRALITGETTLASVAEALDLDLWTDRLVRISHWTTPPIMPRRFDTRFFAAELPAGAEPSFDPGEVTDHRWLTARAALDACSAGDIAMWVPTSATLQQLEFASGLTELRASIAFGPVPAPRVVEERPGLTRIVLGSAGAVPGQTVNGYLVGRREIVAVDPGDPSDAAADAMLANVAGGDGRLVAIALTNADPDHAAGAEGLALRLEVPIFGGRGVGRVVPYAVTELDACERFPAGDVEVEVMAAPGPRPDHVGFAVRGKGDGTAVLAGDLVGGCADRAILAPPDEAAWSASLERLRALGPARIYPGHGEPTDQ